LLRPRVALRLPLGSVAEAHEAVETRSAIRSLVARLSETTDRDLSGLRRVVEEPTESVRQLEVWRETGSTLEVARDLARRTRDSAGYATG
jgi:carboxylate-amine ligase